MSERYVHEAPVDDDAERVLFDELADRKQFVDAGPKNLEYVPLTEIHLLEQPRSKYDQKAIEELAFSMVKDWGVFEAATTLEEIEAQIDLYHPPIINRLTPDYLPTYLDHHARFYKIPTPVLQTDPGQNTSINGGGHTRYLAYEFLLKYRGFTKENGRMLCQVRYNMSHAETLEMQLRENKKSNPPPEDIAVIIERIANEYEDIHGSKPTPGQLSKRTGLTQDVIRAATLFTSLPRSIQDYVGDPRKERAKKRSGKEFKDVVPYTRLVRLGQLQAAVAEKYTRDHYGRPGYTNEARDEHVERELQIVTKEIARHYAQRAKAGVIDEYVQWRINAAQGALGTEQLEMIYVADAHDIGRRHERAQDALGQRCIETLRLMAEQGAWKPGYTEELQDVLALIDRRDNPVAAEDPLF